MQLDAEEDDQLFYKPPVEPVARPSETGASSETATDSQAAAVTTADGED